MKCFTRSMKPQITQKRGRSGWHLWKTPLAASDRALPILRLCLRSCDDRRVQCPTARAKRPGQKGKNRITGAKQHRKSTTERIICQAGESTASLGPEAQRAHVRDATLSQAGGAGLDGASY
jgi:hypothetical protein